MYEDQMEEFVCRYRGLKPMFQGETTGAFQKLKLTGWTIARHVILATKNAFSKRFR